MLTSISIYFVSFTFAIFIIFSILFRMLVKQLCDFVK